MLGKNPDSEDYDILDRTKPCSIQNYVKSEAIGKDKGKGDEQQCKLGDGERVAVDDHKKLQKKLWQGMKKCF